MVGLVASCYIDPTGHVGCGAGVMSSVSSPEGGGGGAEAGPDKKQQLQPGERGGAQVGEQRRRQEYGRVLPESHQRDLM